MTRRCVRSGWCASSISARGAAPTTARRPARRASGSRSHEGPEPPARPPGGARLCFGAPDRAGVRAFYTAALAAGGRDDGPPGLRPQYHAAYYGAFVLDPDGHRIEAVCHAPEAPAVIA